MRKAALANGAFDAVVCTHWSDGGAGATGLADAVIKACEAIDDKFKFLYDLNTTIEEKITKIATEMYGAGGVEFTPQAKGKIELYSKLVCFMKMIFKLSLRKEKCKRNTKIFTSHYPGLRQLGYFNG